MKYLLAILLFIISTAWGCTSTPPERAGSEGAVNDAGERVGERVGQVYYGNAFEPREYYGARLEPRDKVLHGAGQDPGAFAEYVREVGPEYIPAYMMTYFPVPRSPRHVREVWGPKMVGILEKYPDDMGLQVGMSFDGKSEEEGAEYARRIIAGELEEGILAFAEVVDAMDRPIFVRVGYEFNGGWNHYQTQTYKPAFRHVAELLRGRSERIAVVWCAHPEHELAQLMEWYPGDDVVDWWAIDLFEPKYLVRRVVRDFLEEADRNGKPVMIGEATPAQVGTELGAASWQAWYLPFFELVRSQPGIKAISYIHRDWRKPTGLDLEVWGDSRIQTDETVHRKYVKNIAMPLYQHTAGEMPSRE